MPESLIEKHKRLIIIVFAFILFFSGLYFFITNRINNIWELQEEEITITNSLDKDIQQMLKGPVFGSGILSFDDYVKMPVQEPLKKAFLKFLVLHDGIKGAANIPFNAIYDIKINEKLGTSGFLKEKKLDGIILQRSGQIESKFYTDENNRNRRIGYRDFVALIYVKLPEKKVVKRDTVWGGEPPETIGSREILGHGGPVAAEDIVAAVKKN